MARMRVFMVFVLAVTAGGALAFGTYNYMQHLPPKTVSMPTQQVVVAASDLDIGTELGRSDIRIIDWPANAVPAGAFRHPQDGMGRRTALPIIQTPTRPPQYVPAAGTRPRPPPA